jgi:hypothetical protein
LNRVLLADPHLTVTLDEETGLVRYVRSREPYATLDVARTIHEKLPYVLPAQGQRRPLKLLIDVRAAPPRNDDAFEKEILRLFATFIMRFTAHAFLVKSAAGRLQTQRMAKERGGGDAAVFDEEKAALRHLGVPVTA